MIAREQITAKIEKALGRSRVVALLGPRQSGKTTLARAIAEKHHAAFYDLEDAIDLAKLTLAREVLGSHQGLVVLDEIQFRPDLLPLLRVLADRKPLPAKFLILGSASPDIMRHASESLAGRVEFIEIQGLQLAETGTNTLHDHWNRGGFPLSYLANDEEDSFVWRESFIRTFLERDLRAFGFHTSPHSMHRLWRMIAHSHGCQLNASELGRSLGESSPTIKRHLEILAGVFMVRLLEPWHENLGKRLVKQPKIYVRDSGLLHALLGVESYDELHGHPKCGASWEGYCIEQLIQHHSDATPYFWATQGGAELDLLLVRRGKRHGFEIKYTETPTTTKSMHIALEDLQLDKLTVIHPGKDRYQLAEKIEAVPLSAMLDR
jgi:predicted AAA+ superfamily ATPase